MWNSGGMKQGQELSFDDDGRPILITRAAPAYEEQHRARVRKYLTLMSFRVPALILAAADDPFVPAEQFHDAAFRDNPNVHVYVAPHGGHCAFLSPNGYWAETTAMDFLNAAMPMTDRAR